MYDDVDSTRCSTTVQSCLSYVHITNTLEVPPKIGDKRRAGTVRCCLVSLGGKEAITQSDHPATHHRYNNNNKECEAGGGLPKVGVCANTV